MSAALTSPLGGALPAARSTLLPGGVNSPVRAMRAIGRDPIFIASGAGSRIRDVDGNEYVDWVGSWGPLILGHAASRRASRRSSAAAARGTTFGAPTEGEVELAEAGGGADPVGRDAADDLLGHRGDDERDPAGPRGDGARARAQVRRRLPRPRRRSARARPARASRRRGSRPVPAFPRRPRRRR